MFASPEQILLYMLFGYETDGGRNSYLWDNPHYFSQPTGQGGKMLDENFAEWRQTKRAFTRNEITEGIWIKISDTGHTFMVKFHPDGSLSEHGMFDERNEWGGRWELVGIALRMTINGYSLDVLAAKTGSIHSGLETSPGEGRPSTYFKVIHLQ
ncbi:MAG TPA: hypothetical protein VKT82_28805 [Ktedonobacterales bacterium]|nr:hypothetical protein [Ktedonobacterales bacterium]